MATLLLAAAVLVATSAPAASGEVRAPAGDALALRRLTEQRFEAAVTDDRSFYERLLEPHFRLLDPSHFPPFTKQAYLDAEFPPQRAPRAKATLIVVTNESGRLMAQVTGQEKVELFPESATSFFDRTDSPQARTVFERDASGTVVAQTYRAQGNQVRARKIGSLALEAPVHTEIERLNHSWLEAWLAKDAATIEAMMAPEYTYIAPNGQVMDRARILAIVRSPGYRLDRSTGSEVRVTVFKDSAIVLRRSQSAGSFDGQAFTEDHRCTSLWVRRAGAWQLGWEHCSPIAP